MKIVKRTSAICIHRNRLLVFKAEDPISGEKYYFLPGGKPDKHETLIKCVMRETWEETGYRIVVEENSKLVKEYFFLWNGKKLYCKTYFYRAFLRGQYHPPGKVQDEEYNKGPAWIPLSKAREIFSYNFEIQQAVLSLI